MLTLVGSSSVSPQSGLVRELRALGLEVRPTGVQGRSLAAWSRRLRELRRIAPTSGEVLVYMPGPNDTRLPTPAQVIAVGGAVASKGASVRWLLPPDYPRARTVYRERASRMREAIVTAGVTTLDLAWRSESDFGADGLHLSAAGARRIARQLATALGAGPSGSSSGGAGPKVAAAFAVCLAVLYALTR